jgi:recombination protein RecT
MATPTKGRVPEKESLPYSEQARPPANVPNRPPAVATIKALLVSQRAQITMALPRNQSVDRVIRTALTAVQQNPDLIKCDPVSILAGVIQASELGLELSNQLGQAYLIPRKGRATFQVGYRGFVNLAHRGGRVAKFAAFIVHQGDDFSYALGTDDYIRHKPCQKPGPVTHVYAIVTYRHGGKDFEVMTLEEVLEHRRRYSQARPGPYNPWDTSPEEMFKKTVIKRLAKRCPVSVEMQRAEEADKEPSEEELEIPFVSDDGEIIDAEYQVHPDEQDQASAAPTEEQMLAQDAELAGREGE